MVGVVGALDAPREKPLAGKIALVTGANSGMGKATCAALADMGAEVILLCRDQARGMRAFQELVGSGGRKLRLMLCDLGDLASIRAFASEFRVEYGRADILVNNAGCLLLARQTTKNGFERQFGVNHLGHFALTLLLRDMMPPGSRIVVVTSGAYKIGRMRWNDFNFSRGYCALKAYAQSKLANVLFTKALARRLAPFGITVNCCHPGAVATGIGVNRETGFGKTAARFLRPLFLTPEKGAATALFLAGDPSVASVTGEYFYRKAIHQTSARAQSEQDQERLFKASEALTGISFETNHTKE